MILGKDPRKKWSMDDLLLSQAYVIALDIIESERCPQCGLHKAICHDSENAVRIHLDEDFCNVKFEIDKKQESDRKARKKDDDGRDMWGSQLSPRIEFVPGEDLSTVRERWLEEQRILAEARG